MLTEVFCPKCQAKLRSPTDLTGKTVRCSKCQERFRASDNAAPPAASIGDTQMLSAMDLPAPKAIAKPARSALEALDDVPVSDAMTTVKAVAKPVAAAPPTPAPAAAFAFDEEPPEKTKKKKKPPVEEEEIETVDEAVKSPPTADAFSFDDAPEPPKKKKSSKRVIEEEEDDEDDDEDVKDRKRGKKEEKKGSPILPLMIVGFVLLLIVAAVAGWWVLIKQPALAKAKASIAAPIAAPVESKTSKPDAKSTATKATEPSSTKPTPPETGTGGKPKPPPKGGPKTPPAAAKGVLPKPPTAETAIIAVASKEKFVVDVAPDLIKAFRVAGDSTDRKVFIVRNSFAGFQGQGALDTIDRYAADTGAKIGSCEVKADGVKWPRPFEASPDGKHIVVEGPAGMLNLYSFEENKFLLQGVDPFAGKANRKGPLRGLAWKGNGRFVVCDHSGNPDEWSVADKKLASASKTNLSEPESDAKIIVSALDSKGEFIAIVRGSQFHISQGGALKGPGALPETSAVPIAVAGSALADKLKLAVVANIKGTEQHMVYVLNLSEASAKPIIIALPDGLGAVTGIAWQSIFTLVVTIEGGAAALLVDIEEEVAVGYLKSPTAKPQVFAKAPFNTLWYAIPDSAGKTQISSINLDFNSYKPMAEAAKANKMPAFIVVKDTGIEK